MDAAPDFKLCYVEEPFAWFTTAPLAEQWGDDWNDAPYEHNAGHPYEWHAGSGKERYELLKVAYDGPFDLPCDHQTNSCYTVQLINQGVVPWLTTRSYHQGPLVQIQAGTSLGSFVRQVHGAGGHVYLMVQDTKAYD